MHEGGGEGHSCEIDIDNKDRLVLWEVQNAKKVFLWESVILELQMSRLMEYLVECGSPMSSRITKGGDTTTAGIQTMILRESGATLMTQMRPGVTALFQSAGTPG